MVKKYMPGLFILTSFIILVLIELFSPNCTLCFMVRLCKDMYDLCKIYVHIQFMHDRCANAFLGSKCGCGWMN